MVNKHSKRIFYFDALRALAIVSVIVYHIFSGGTLWMVKFDYALIPTLNWLINDIGVNCFRIGVVLFLMLSGALSLGRQWSVKSMLSKRIPRIVYPFLIWSCLFIFLFLLLAYFFNFTFINQFDLYNIGLFIYQSLFALNNYFNHLWFFWMIIGTYLIMPVFNRWVLGCDLKEVEYFLCLWLVTCLFTYTLRTPFPISLKYFVSPIGLVVLGYYLRYTERELLNNPYFDIFLIIFSCTCMVIGSYLFSIPGEMFIFSRYSIFTAIEVIGVFLLFKNFTKLNLNIDFITNPNKWGHKIIMSFAKYSYGLYLVHLPILRILIKILPIDILHFKGTLVCVFILDVSLSFMILYIFSKLPFFADKIGVK